MAKKKVQKKSAPAVKTKRAELEKQTKKAIAKAEKEMKKAEKKVRAFIKKNPEKATVIAAGIGAALAAGVTTALSRTFKRKR